jgi:cell division protein FtsB
MLTRTGAVRRANARADQVTGQALLLTVQLAAEQAKNLLLTGELRNANDENEALEAKNEALETEKEALEAQSAGFERQAHRQYSRHNYYMFKDLDNHRKRKAAEAELSKALDALDATISDLEKATKKSRK